MIVVDTNVIAYLFIKGEHTQNAKRLFLKDPEWIAPYLWRNEFRNIVATYLHQEYLSLENALKLVSEAESFMQGSEFHVSANEVIDLVYSSRCSAYDCEFAVLAKNLGLKLYTSDKQLIHEFPDVVVPLASIE